MSVVLVVSVAMAAMVATELTGLTVTIRIWQDSPVVTAGTVVTRVTAG